MTPLRVSRAFLLLSMCSRVFTQTTAMTGDAHCETQFCVSAAVSGQNVQYVMQSTGSLNLGWMAIGFGDQMAGSPMVVMWPNLDGTVTLSHRNASGETQPKLDIHPPRVASISTSLSLTNVAKPKLAFTIPANSDTKQNIIWGLSARAPNSSAVDTRIPIHDVFGSASLDLTKAISYSSFSDPASSTVFSSIPLLPYQKVIAAHGIVCAVGFMLFLPAGALLARYWRTFSPQWFQGHWIAQFGLAAPIIIAGVALGIKGVADAGDAHFNDDHKNWGIAVFILYFLQCAIGAFIHWVKPKNVRGRPAQNYLHAVLGVLILAVSFYQVRTGYKSEWPMATGLSDLPKAVEIVWIVWIVLIPLLYILGLTLLGRQFRQEKEARAARDLQHGVEPKLA